VKQQFPEIALGFGCLELGVRAPIGKPWLWKLGIVRRDHHFLDATDLLIDEPAQLSGTVALSGEDSAAQHGNSQDSGHLLQEQMPAGRLRRRSAAWSIRALYRVLFRFLHHVRASSALRRGLWNARGRRAVQGRPSACSMTERRTSYKGGVER
jgi:hypothetical protein